jgi:hypothetical protein
MEKAGAEVCDTMKSGKIHITIAGKSDGVLIFSFFVCKIKAQNRTEKIYMKW